MTTTTIKEFEDIAFRPIGMYENHIPAIKWGEDNGVYNDPLFCWSTSEKVAKDRRFSSMPNIATMLGRTHKKDPATREYYNLNVLDTDSQTVCNRLRVPLRTILDNSSYDWVTNRLRDLLQTFLNEEGVANGNLEETLLDTLKKSGYVTKTRKEFGYHFYWLDLKQNPPIGTADCLPGNEFELKTNDKYGLCTLPDSTHRDDPNFKYKAIGRTDANLVSNVLYDLFVEMFKDCIASGRLDDGYVDSDTNNKNKKKNTVPQTDEIYELNQKQKEQNDIIVQLYNLSDNTIKATVGYLSDLVVSGHRHWFYVYLAGMTFFEQISLESAFSIVQLLCGATNDEETKSRIENLRLSYRKGMNGERLKGVNALTELIANTSKEFHKDTDKIKARLLILTKMWAMDIEANGGKESNGLDEEKPKKSKLVLDLLRPHIELLFKDGSNITFAAIYMNDDVRHIVPIHKSKQFNLWVRRMYYEKTDNTISGDILNEVADTLESEALFKGPIKELEPRFARDPDNPLVYWYDLGNERWDAIRISPDGWSIVESKNSPIVFRRYANQLSQAIPARYYPDDIFEQFMKIVNVRQDSQIRLVYKCYVISLLIPKIGKPIFMVEGPQDSGKTTAQDLTVSVVHPCKATNFNPPRSEDDIPQQLQHNPIVYYDNLSYMPTWLSNALCRAATGSASHKRELYTDDEDFYYKYKRAVGFNGIVLAANRADLLDRGFVLEIEAVDDKNRLTLEDDILPELERIRPQLFGFILDILVGMLRMKVHGGIKLKSLSRMADFEKHGEMIAQCLGYKELEFINAYRSNKKVGTKQVIENSPVANAMLEYMKEKNAFVGYASQLLDELVPVAISKLKIDVNKDKGWPRSANLLSRRLKELKRSLLQVGIQVFWIDDPTLNRKTLNIVRVSPLDVAKTSPTSSTSPVQDDLRTSETVSTGDTGDESSTFKRKGGISGIYKASWTGVPEVWACRYCGLKGDKSYLLERHDCPELKKEDEKQES